VLLTNYVMLTTW